ncbi:aldehyde dehydrogenase family protein [Burkholderia humptydooensis MSMB43]|uniref:Aldehyde dehydrogenase family protein n=1 Tax=Burkholderia humptydooensis MSMB43 TaxID=441157 RepID=A0ABN0GBE6_9BURK|nr:aldehyde dehydrogenase family protein [Burkholderia humptydooensis MSMB43]
MSGELMLGGERVAPGERAVRAIDPATGATLEPPFALATPADVARACELAAAAFDAYRDTEPNARAAFLEAIATEIEALGDALIERAIAETALPRARLEGERARTCGQLRLFASVVRAGDAVGARIDSALPAREPLPRADLRMRRIALGPVALALVADPRIRAVGFTGSRAGGEALLRIAQSRAQPIPMYGELSAINPVFLLPDALAQRGGALGRQFVASLTLGAGQFCTNPGLLLAIDGPGVDAFVHAAADALATSAAQPMLTPGIHSAYVRGVERLAATAGVRCVARGDASDLPNRGRAGLFETDARHFIAQPALHDEIFGATALLVRCRDAAELCAIAERLDGQLTATLHLDDGDASLARALLPVLERKAGRIIANGWPTGVEVCHAMVHGGPWPATTDARATSVGTAAIERFLRPICYQDLPAALLPPALQDDNPLRLRRLVDGTWA